MKRFDKMKFQNILVPYNDSNFVILFTEQGLALDSNCVIRSSIDFTILTNDRYSSIVKYLLIFDASLFGK